jgi:hypothetical protein
VLAGGGREGGADKAADDRGAQGGVVDEQRAGKRLAALTDSTAGRSELR